jgi:hypothetical protein
VQQRRQLPTRLTQALQVAAQNRIISRVLESGGKLEAPSLIRLLARFPVLRRIPARLIGLGIRPEHVRSESVQPEPVQRQPRQPEPRQPDHAAERSPDSPAPTHSD